MHCAVRAENIVRAQRKEAVDGRPLSFTVRSHGVRTAVILALGLCAMSASVTGQSPTMGAEAVRQIDWTAIGSFSPIPESMPTRISDDPVEAGFAPQWIERALTPGYDAYAQFALKIASSVRAPDDEWSYNMRSELRTLVRTKIPQGKNVRVFCNAVGCLCYVERDEPNYVTDSAVWRELLGETGRQLRLGRKDLVVDLVHDHRPGVPWELTIIRNPTSALQRRSP